MEHEETYHGQRIAITTRQEAGGSWSVQAELLASGRREALGTPSDERYDSEEEARRAGLTVAAEAIDRSRTARGKP